MPGMATFGNLKQNALFDEPAKNLLFGEWESGERYRKIKECLREGRLVNAKTIDGEDYCWIAPSHHVIPVR